VKTDDRCFDCYYCVVEGCWNENGEEEEESGMGSCVEGSGGAEIGSYGVVGEFASVEEEESANCDEVVGSESCDEKMSVKKNDENFLLLAHLHGGL